jgi:tripartite ATP-independent transporter DctM subunit
MGVSLAVKRGAVTVITFVSDRGPPIWQAAVRTFSGAGLALLLGYACVRSTQYAISPESIDSSSPALGIPFFFPIASMTLGYWFITLHLLQAFVAGAARFVRQGPVAAETVAKAVAYAFVIGVAVWALCAFVLRLGTEEILSENVAKLLALGVIFVTLTLAGNPIVFMLSIVGILSTTAFLGLVFYPDIGTDPLFPFRTTQTIMGLSAGTELLVILMFLVIAEVMNASGMSDRLIRFAATLVGHLRGGMAYVCQLTSVMVSGISGSAQADAAVMTPLLVPAMEQEGYRRDVAAAVVAGASIKGPLGPLSLMFIFYGFIVQGEASASISALILTGIPLVLLLFVFQAATVYLVVRRMNVTEGRPFAGVRAVGREGVSALPLLLVPVIIVGGILSGIFTPTESAAVASVLVIGMAMFGYAGLSPRGLSATMTSAGLETGIVLLLLGDSYILARVLEINQFGDTLKDALLGLTDNTYVFLLVVNVILLLVGIFVEPLPALIILAPFLAPVAVIDYGIDPVQFGIIMVFNLVLALIHPPIGLVLFLVSSIARVTIERLSIMIIPWLAVSILVLFLVTYLPATWVLWFSNLVG